MTDLESEIEAIMGEVCEEAAQRVASIATEYFVDRFEEKEWDGVKWEPAKNPPNRGSLMLRRSWLRNSIGPVEVTQQRVIIKAGDDMKITYARAHNEGFEGDVNVSPFIRNVKGKRQEVRGHIRRMRIPKRQFMGVTKELEDSIASDMEALIESKFNK